MLLKVSDLRKLDVEIRKDGEVVYTGNVDDVPEEYRNSYYKKIDGAYPVVIEL